MFNVYESKYIFSVNVESLVIVIASIYKERGSMAMLSWPHQEWLSRYRKLTVSSLIMRCTALTYVHLLVYWISQCTNMSL